MTVSILQRLKAQGLIQLAAEIDETVVADGETGATDDTVVVDTDDAAADAAVTAESLGDADIAIEIRGDLDEADSIIVEIRKDDAMGEELAGAAEELTETVITTESYMKEGGMHAQTAQEHLAALRKLGKVVGFAIPPTLPSFESFGGLSGRLDATGMVLLEEQNWLKKLWATLKGWLKTAYDNVATFLERVFTTAGKLETRGKNISAAIMKRAAKASDEKIKIPARITALIGTGSVKSQAEAVVKAFDAAWAASQDRAEKFSSAVIGSLSTGDTKSVGPAPITSVSGPAGWAFKSEGANVSWVSDNKGTEVEVAVASREEIKAAADLIVELAGKMKEAKTSGGKASKAYSDAVAAGDKFTNSVSSKGGAVDGEKKKEVTAILNTLKEVRTTFSSPGVEVASWAGKAGNAVLDVLGNMARKYGAEKKEAKPAEAAAK